MILRQVVPVADETIDLTAPDARERLAALYAAPRPDWVRLNLIASVDGGGRGPDGTSESLSSRADRAVLGAIRQIAEVVLVGAGTLRAEGTLLPRTTPLAVATMTGELGDAMVRRHVEPGSVLVLGPARAEPRARASLRIPFDFVACEPDAERGGLAAEVILTALRERYAHIVCEGGPRLAASLLDAGLVDELCLSTSPRLAGGALPVLGVTPRDEPLRLERLLVDDAGGSYARWRVGSEASQSRIAPSQRAGS